MCMYVYDLKCIKPPSSPLSTGTNSLVKATSHHLIAMKLIRQEPELFHKVNFMIGQKTGLYAVE